MMRVKRLQSKSVTAAAMPGRSFEVRASKWNGSAYRNACIIGSLGHNEQVKLFFASEIDRKSRRGWAAEVVLRSGNPRMLVTGSFGAFLRQAVN